jgi:glycosyltransferase involved in cell wall biosynthesis
MKALIVAPQPFFSPRGTPLSVYYRTLVLAELGVEADLLTYGEGEDVDIAGVRTIRIPRVPVLEPVKVGPSAAKVFLDALLALWLVALLVRRRYDFVDAHEESVFICRFLKPLFRFKLVYEMHSSLPQQLRSFEFTRSRILIRLFEWLERSSLRAADAVVTISPSLARYARARMPDEARHFLIENSIVEEVKLSRRPAPPGPGGETRGPELPPGRPLVAFAGTFEPYQGLDLLLEAFRLLHRERSDVALLLVGGTPEQVAHYRRLAGELGVEEDCIFTGRLAQSAARRLTAAAGVVTSPRLEGTSTPLKIYEQLAGGVPLVATRIEAHTEVLDDEVCWLAEPEAGSLSRAILAALEDSDEARRRAEAARKRYDARYSRPLYVGKVRRLLDCLVDEP